MVEIFCFLGRDPTELLCTHENLVVSHTELEIAHEVILKTVKSYEPRVKTSTPSTHNANLTCASPSDSSIANAICCDESLIVPYCSNINVSSSSTCDSNIVEEIKELKDQVNS